LLFFANFAITVWTLAGGPPDGPPGAWPERPIKRHRTTPCGHYCPAAIRTGFPAGFPPRAGPESYKPPQNALIATKTRLWTNRGQQGTAEKADRI
jgi:hypothetical protein